MSSTNRRPMGLFNPMLAAMTGRWAKRPVFESDHLLRAAARVIRRRKLPIKLFDLKFERSDKRSTTTWGHVATTTLNSAAVARRRGDYSLARVLIKEARDAIRLSQPVAA